MCDIQMLHMLLAFVNNKIYFCNMLKRIREIITSEGLSSTSFADEIGVQRSSLSHILNGRNNASLDFVTKTLKRFPNINPEWFIIGTGSMYKSDPQANNDIIIDEPVRETRMSTPDLFSAFGDNKSASSEIKSSSPVIEEPVKQELPPQKGDKYVTQIMIFYSDSTYQTYKPEKFE